MVLVHDICWPASTSTLISGGRDAVLVALLTTGEAAAGRVMVGVVRGRPVAPGGGGHGERTPSTRWPTAARRARRVASSSPWRPPVTHPTSATRSRSACSCATSWQEPPMMVTPKPREQTRARYPDEEGYIERDGFGSSTRSMATRRRRSCCSRRRRSRTRGCGRRRSRISRATFASSRSTHGVTGGRTGRTRPRPTRTGNSWRTVAPSSRRPEPRRHSSPVSATVAAGR